MVVINTQTMLEKARRLTEESYKIDGFTYILHVNKGAEVNEKLLDDVHMVLSTVVQTTTDVPMFRVLRSVDVVFHSTSVVDIIVDADEQFRALYFGKEFCNQRALKRLLSNLAAKYSKITGMGHLVKVANVER